jgi:hypothetical protein
MMESIVRNSVRGIPPRGGCDSTELRITPPYGEDIPASIQGWVLDPSGAAIPSAGLAVESATTAVVTKTNSAEDGSYGAPFRNAGTYGLQVTAAHTQTPLRDGLKVRVNEQMQMDVTLRLGAASGTVTLNAETSLPRAATRSLGRAIGSRRAADLPVREGNPFSPLILSLGTVSTLAACSSPQAPVFYQNSASNGSISCSPIGSTEFTPDGSPDTRSDYSGTGGGGTVQSPPADLIEGFKLGIAFGASAGRTRADQPIGEFYFIRSFLPVPTI